MAAYLAAFCALAEGHISTKGVLCCRYTDSEVLSLYQCQTCVKRLKLIRACLCYMAQGGFLHFCPFPGYPGTKNNKKDNFITIYTTV